MKEKRRKSFAAGGQQLSINVNIGQSWKSLAFGENWAKLSIALQDDACTLPDADLEVLSNLKKETYATDFASVVQGTWVFES